LTSERNSLKNKNSSISKEVYKLKKDCEGFNIDNSVLKAENRSLEDDISGYKRVMDDVKTARARVGEGEEAERVFVQNNELERVVMGLTESLSNKEMQIEVMRDVNRQLALEMRALKEVNGESGEFE
jgi:FtsZ-binding cell division protein ZapB